MGMVVSWKIWETTVRRAKLMGSVSVRLCFRSFFFFPMRFVSVLNVFFPEALYSVAVMLSSVRLAGWFGLLDLGAVIVGGGNLMPFPVQFRF